MIELSLSDGQEILLPQERMKGKRGHPPYTWQICPGLNANEIQIPYDKHHKVSSLVKPHQNTQLSNMK